MLETAMHAYICESTTSAQELDVSKLLSKTFTTVEIVSTETIAQVRELKKQFLFSPGSETLFILTNLDEAKAETQNAILKLIEEPPHEKITFLILVKNENGILPTIFSRVQKIFLKQNEKNKKQILTGEPNTWFLPLSKLTDRDEAIETMQSVLEGEYNAHQKESALKTIEALKKNGNVTLQLTNFVVACLP